MAKSKSKLDQKLDAFARVTFLTEDGRPKSAVWLYAFLISLGIAILTVALYLLLGFWLGAMAAGSIGLIVLHAVLTAALGSIPSILLARLLRDEHKVLIAYAYVWLLVLFVLSLIMGVLLCDWAGGSGWIDLVTLSTIVFFPALLSILIGGVPAWLLWRAAKQRMLAEEEEAAAQAPKRPSYYNT